ncbi:MAG: lipoprotein insertase outer membrane protein LolB [Aquabacterium sp.]|jgi:outer membrane lipoprotein LolB|uniref:lipoprotein insertase outer membrane protein LolB n=1 Tax=Aquabacterium sp. TaxID=1872578 RepID=UPI002A35AF6C|nr:lipoprotein insertase outer membrane protein LolB [Aquabacterium sp.]MDX9844529.1 lipoprotein insertase outer membrane protein LolB [Aquabacterium sp.]
MRALPLLAAWPSRLGLLGLACALSGCGHLAAVPHPPADAPGTTASSTNEGSPRLALQGQLSIKLQAWQDLPAKGLSLGFFFSGHTDQGLLDLMTPLGTLMAQVGWHADEAWVVSQEGRQTYADLDELSRQTLGEALPLRSLVHWMQGQPDPTQPSTPDDQPGVFEQAGWRIDTRELGEQRIQATRSASEQQRAIHIKVYLDR